MAREWDEKTKGNIGAYVMNNAYKERQFELHHMRQQEKDPEVIAQLHKREMAGRVGSYIDMHKGLKEHRDRGELGVTDRDVKMSGMMVKKATKAFNEGKNLYMHVTPDGKKMGSKEMGRWTPSLKERLPTE